MPKNGVPVKRSARVGVGVLACCALGLSTATAHADEFEDRFARAASLAQAEHYREALAELEAAYALRQSPRVLYVIATLHQRLGDASAALAYYQRFLTADSDPDPKFRTDAEQQVARLNHVLGRTAPAPVLLAPPPGAGVEQPPVEVRYEMKPSVGLMAGGATLFGAAYLGAVVSGAIYVAPGSGCVTYNYPGVTPCPGGNQQVAGGLLLIPVAGPFLAAVAYRDPTWSVSWSLVDGIAQVGGVAMMAYAARHPRKVPVYGERFELRPYTSRAGGGLQAVGRF